MILIYEESFEKKKNHARQSRRRLSACIDAHI
jgi:hypothetical protein